jgi:hypothetical protein
MKRLRSRAVVIATILAFVVLSTGALAVFFATPAQAHSSTVTILDGSVQVRHAGGAFAPLTDGDIVAGGDTVRTGANSHSVLTFFDGSTVELEPDTELRIDTLQASASGDKVVQMSQAIGRTWHVVTHLVSPSSTYEIRTPVSTAAVRGTAFEVVVEADGTTSTETTEGNVSTIAEGADVHVLAGQTNIVRRGLPPELPQPAPEPSATVKVILDLTQNALVTDVHGRSVGVQNGMPIRYIPGSKVEVIDGKLVITIPNAQLGLLNMYIKPDAGRSGGASPSAVTIQTQVIVKGIGIVANSVTSRPVVNGIAKGGIVVTDTGLLLVPDSDLRNAPAPHIGTLPSAPTGIFAIVVAPTIAPLVQLAPPSAGAPVTVVDATAALEVTSAAFVPYSTVTAPLAPVVQSVTAPVTTVVGSLPGATATPAPILTLPTNVFATATPASAAPVIVTPPLLNGAAPTIAVPITVPTPLPVPSVGGFVPALTGLVPTVPPPVAVVTPTAPILAGPTPTAAPVVQPVVSVPPVATAPATQAPATVAPVVSTPAPTVAPTPVPTPAPTPVPTQAPTPKPLLCLPLLGCI